MKDKLSEIKCNNIFGMECNYNPQEAKQYILQVFDSSYLPSLQQFVSIPNLSRLYDPQWDTNGLLEKAATHIQSWVHSLHIKGLTSEIIKDPGYSPLLLVEIDGAIEDKTILFYGHFDKQPHMDGWDEDKGPTQPVIIDGKLYGRGACDDGYNAYSSMLAVKAVQHQGLSLPKILMILEGDQESGNHIEHYLSKLKDKIGTPQVVFCLDSGALDYERMWITKSIRGYIDFELRIKTLTQGIHSGDASGIVPSTFKIANQLLARLQNLETGEVNKHFEVDIPASRYKELYDTAKLMGTKPFDEEQTVHGLKFVSESALDLYLNQSWRPQMTVIGISHFPPTQQAGNVMLPQLAIKINMRSPPTFNTSNIGAYLEDLLTKNTPFGCEVKLGDLEAASGWNSHDYEPWMQDVIDVAAKSRFGHPSYGLCVGGAVPIISILGESFPASQIIVSGVVGPKANAHGPNEFLDLAYVRKLTCAVADIVAGCSKHYAAE